MTTRKLIPLITICIFVFATAHGQDKDNKSLALAKIKKTYEQINSYKNYKTVTIDNTEDFLGHNTDNGGTLTGFYKDDSLKKIVEWVGLSNRVVQNEYYLDNNKLIFVYSTESKYRFNDSTQSFDYSKLDNVFKGRYYFDNNKLLDTILNDKDHIKTKQKDAIEFLISSNNFTKLLGAKNK
jgi:hypothetical protein